MDNFKLNELNQSNILLGENRFEVKRGTPDPYVIVIKNDFYTGIVSHGIIKMKGNHGSIINKAIFGNIQSLLSKNRKNI